MTMTDLLVIANGRNGDRSFERLRPRIVPILRKAAGGAPRVRFTSGPGHATELAREALRAGVGWIVVAGGDGTINEVLNGYLGPDGAISGRAPLSFLPLGSGNDWMRSFGDARDPVRAAEMLADSRIRAVDVGVAQFRDPFGAPCRRLFLNFAEAGVGASSVRPANGSPRRPGSRRTYLLSAVAAAFRYSPEPIELACDGKPPRTTEPLLSLIVANGRFFGAGIQCAPMAQPDDGLLDVISIGAFGKLEILRKVRKFVRGRYLAEPRTSHRAVHSVEISAAAEVPFELDGDFVGTLPAAITVLPRALAIRY